MYINRIRTQKELSAVSGIDNGTISRWKNGKIGPNDDSLRKLSEVLGCSFEWLKYGKGELEVRSNKILASIQPGDSGKKRRLIEAGKKITQKDNSLRILVEWMDDYFGNDPDQILPFIFDLARQYPSFSEFLEKKGNGGGVDIRSQAKVSNSD
jgi:transcriptional regulator with XRE-family HTH domain